MITISLCMIVKNEERVLARCLDSICNLMDEIIIVDTGSTDQTKEIAKQYTDKIFDFTWVDDFSAARNFSFSKATKEYIYVADADEVLDEINQERFWKLKQALLPEIEIVQMQYCNQLQFNTTYNYDKEYRPKLYKRVRQFVWVEPIHEAVQIEPVIYDSEIEILHMPESEHGKRDFSLFQAMIRQGKMVSKKLHNMYARELYIAGEAEDFFEAKSFFLQTVQEARSMDEIKEASCILVRVFRLERDIPNFFKYVLKNILAAPCAEICFELGEHYRSILDYTEASIWYYNAAFEAESILNIHCGGDFALEGLASCYEKIKEEKEQDYLKKATALTLEQNKVIKEYEKLAQDFREQAKLWRENH